MSPVGVKTKLHSLHDVSCHLFNDWTVIPCSKTLHAVDQALNGLWMFLIHLLLRHPPKMKIQWIQIREWADQMMGVPRLITLSWNFSIRKSFAKFRMSVSHLKNPLIMNKMAYHKYNISRWFGNMSHLKKDNLKETPCTWIYDTSKAVHMNGYIRGISVHPVGEAWKVHQKCIGKIETSGASNLCLDAVRFIRDFFNLTASCRSNASPFPCA